MQISALDPSGPQAQRIDSIWWYMFWVSAVVWAIVVVALLYSAWHSNKRSVPDASDEVNARMRQPVIGATIITVLILVATLVYDVTTGEALASLPRRHLGHHHARGGLLRRDRPWGVRS